MDSSSFLPDEQGDEVCEACKDSPVAHVNRGRRLGVECNLSARSREAGCKDGDEKKIWRSLMDDDWAEAVTYIKKGRRGPDGKRSNASRGDFKKMVKDNPPFT